MDKKLLNIFRWFLSANRVFIYIGALVFLVFVPIIYYFGGSEFEIFLTEASFELAHPIAGLVDHNFFFVLLIYLMGFVMFMIVIAILNNLIALFNEVKAQRIFNIKNYLHIENITYYVSYLILLSYIFFDELEFLSITSVGILVIFTIIFRHGIALQEERNLTI